MIVAQAVAIGPDPDAAPAEVDIVIACGLAADDLNPDRALVEDIAPVVDIDLGRPKSTDAFVRLLIEPPAENGAGDCERAGGAAIDRGADGF